MPNWCANRLYISGSHEQISDVKKLMKGELYPLYQEAIKKSIKFFIAGCAGIVKPIQTIEQDVTLLFNKSNALIPYELGEVNYANQAFTQWLNLLKTDPSLTKEVSEKVIALYQQSGLAGTSLEAISLEQLAVINQLFETQQFDWLGSLKYDPKNIGAYWQQFDEKPTECIEFDMRLVIAPKLIPEIVGYNGHLMGDTIGQLSSYQSYNTLYGIKWPYGAFLHLEELTPNVITNQSVDSTDNSLLEPSNMDSAIQESILVDFDTPWCQPNKSVLEALSKQYQCTIEHYYCEAGCGFGGYDSYHCGDRVNSVQDDLTYSEPDEDGITEVIGPSYIVNNMINFGG